MYRYEEAPELLYKLLSERPMESRISHKAMPSFKKHCAFIDSAPYLGWYLVRFGDEVVGSAYLTKKDEIGIFIFIKSQGNGYSKKALKLLMTRHPRERYLANINPQNKKSLKLFSGLGFNQIQTTFELTT